MKTKNKFPYPINLSILVIVSTLMLFINPNHVFAQQKKVLFLGNSYTAANDLPSLVAGLALSGGHDIYTDKNTPGGYTLAHPGNGHLTNQTSLDKIAAEDWDYVVLQEQSQFPVIDYYRDNFTYPGAIQLDSIIRENYECSKTLFYMTWGRKFGGEQCIDNHCSVDFTDYAHMQDSLAAAYLSMSNYLETPVCPAGISWRKSIVDNGDPIDLFASDGSHPSLAGSYLTACTYYATIFAESPVGLTFTAGLEESVATYLQNIASETVIGNLELWNIDTTSVTAAFEYDQDGGEFSFENYSVNADSYFWDFGNGDTDTTANPVYIYYESGSFIVSLIASHRCKVDTAYSIVEVVISNLNEIESNILISIFPLPANDFLMIEYQLSEISLPVVLNIIDTRGTICFTSTLENNSDSIKVDIKSFEDGLYIINAVSNNKLIGVSKCLIQH